MQLQENTFNGYGCLKTLKKNLLKFDGVKNIILITGKNSYYSCGVEVYFRELETEYSIMRVSDFSQNTNNDDLNDIKQLFVNFEPHLLVAVGGGSVIDMAKLIAASFDLSPEDTKRTIEGKTNVKSDRLPIVAIPTTAGSGSEATHFAVCYIGREKYSLSSFDLLPSMIFLDGSVLQSSSKYVRATTAIDVLAQSIESAWAKSATDESRRYSLLAFNKAIDNIEEYVAGDNSEHTLQGMIESANLAGKAINISKTTAPHAWSYAFTSNYGIHHGPAVWLTLPKIFQLHCHRASTKIGVLGSAFPILKEMLDRLGISDFDKISVSLRNFINSLGLSLDFAQFGLKMRVIEPLCLAR